MTTIYMSLGSNLGAREKNIRQALAELEQTGVHVLRRSSLYETEPVDLLEQPWFLNCAVEAETELAPDDTLDRVLEIETKMGRRREIPSGPRPIDIDILFYGSSVIRTPTLEIPHPRLANRRFVLLPLNEIAPDLRHPILGKTVAELHAATPDRSEVRIWRASEDIE